MAMQLRFDSQFNRRSNALWIGQTIQGLALAVALVSTSASAELPPPTGYLAKNWQVTVAADLARVRAATPELYAQLWTLAPIRTRDHRFKFTSPLLVQPGAAAVLITRLADRSTPLAWRPALAQALEQTGDPNLGAAIAGLMRQESDENVRIRLAFALRRIPGESSHEAVMIGLNDVSAKVRAWTAKARGYQARQIGLTSEVDLKLLDLLHDSDPDAAAQAAWACARLQVREAIPQLHNNVFHSSARVRLASLHALVDLEPAAVDADSVQRLLRDPDARVAALAQRTLRR